MIGGQGIRKKSIQITQEKSEMFSDHFGTPSKNVGDIEKEKDPQERSEYLK